MVNMLREYLISTLRLLPALREELRARTDWDEWEVSVCAALDALRREVGSSATRAVSTSFVLDQCRDFERRQRCMLPATSLYQAPKNGFLQLLVKQCGTYLDTHGGSEQQVDAILSDDMESALRDAITYSGYTDEYELVPCIELPSKDADDDTLRRLFFLRGRFPLRMFYAHSATIREYMYARAEYAKTSSKTKIEAFVRWLGRESIYQLMLICAFASAVIDRARVRAVPLPRHIADLQLTSLRTRLGINGNTEHVPRHLLTSFVCLHCRRFCGQLMTTTTDDDTSTANTSNTIDRSAAAKQRAVRNLATPIFESSSGSNLVACVHDTLESQTRIQRDARSDGRRLPQYSELVSLAREHGTLLHWYQEEAERSETSMYPPLPTIATNPEDSLQRSKDFIEKLSHLRTHDGNFGAYFEANLNASSPVIAPLSDLWKRRIDARNTQCTRDLSSIIDDDGHEKKQSMISLDIEEHYRRRWNELSGGHLRVGHRSEDPSDVRVNWVCVSARKKNERRKTQNTSASTTKMDAALTPRERQVAARQSGLHLRRDTRALYRYSLCSRKLLLEVTYDNARYTRTATI